jgi:hypothetical protein
MARDTRRDERREQRSPSEPEEQQPRRPFDQARDYFKLARFRMEFGSRHIPSEFWKDRGPKQ